MTKIQALAQKAKTLFSEVASPDASRAKRESLINIIDELAGIAEALPVVNGIDDIPPGNGDGFSDDYLIDLDGYRTLYAIGFFDHANARWIIHDADKRTLFELEHMTWQRLPLAKYDSERS